MSGAIDRKSSRIFLIHATPLAIAPIEGSFKKLWPEAVLSNLLDDSLAPDLQRAGRLEPRMIDRFISLSRYAASAGADGILFTCSAFGPAIDACKQILSIPVLRPNEAMIEEALTYGDRLALMATFEPSIASITAEIEAFASSLGRKVAIDPIFVPGAMKAAQEGDMKKHDELAAQAASKPGNADVICFAQFSMSSAAAACAHVSGKPVLTTPDSAVRLMKRRLVENA